MRYKYMLNSRYDEVVFRDGNKAPTLISYKKLSPVKRIINRARKYINAIYCYSGLWSLKLYFLGKIYNKPSKKLNN